MVRLPRTIQFHSGGFQPDSARRPHFTAWLSQGDNWRRILAGITGPIQDTETFVGKLLSEQHRNDCQDSCYDCLRLYRNMSYHGLLDWRLGMSVLRVLSDPAHLCGVNGDFGAPELAGWLEFAGTLRNTFCESFRSCVPAEFGPLHGWTVGGRSFVLSHPLWSTTRPGGLLAEALATLGQDDAVRVVDAFNLHRRMSWVYQRLGA